MKKLNKKGFTIVELVIVIAVIAILAAVLIPTFSGVVDKANKSAAMQGARNAVTGYIADKAETDTSVDLVVLSKEKYFEVKAGEFNKEPITVTTTGTHNYKAAVTAKYEEATVTTDANVKDKYKKSDENTYTKCGDDETAVKDTKYYTQTVAPQNGNDCACGDGKCKLEKGDFVKCTSGTYTLVDTYEGCKVYSK